MTRRVLPLRSIGSASGHRRSIAALALIVGACTAATMLTAAVALADPGPHSSQASGRTASTISGDSTGAHHIDPFGYNHTDPNPLRQNEHRNALREYLNGPKPADDTDTRGDGAATWAAVPRTDGDGWVVCRPNASYC
ncbi:hypothetical protein DFR70_102358 [Nocardia tenerifensis]|uniref:Uncharacterized protein n=1 Tax=Nocardia tenerifensis TaxID=228006 RepID=A0A318K7L3_9NOCA|nr:hypothetical protein [Nocardia tenerifensis]PXX68674.1 hypothetical protein DFR70_102358 [Nocardia tenerifensis]